MNHTEIHLEPGCKWVTEEDETLKPLTDLDHPKSVYGAKGFLLLFCLDKSKENQAK